MQCQGQSHFAGDMLSLIYFTGSNTSLLIIKAKEKVLNDKLFFT